MIEPPLHTKQRFELILETIGGASLSGAMECVALDGVIVVLGNTSGEPTAFDFSHSSP